MTTENEVSTGAETENTAPEQQLENSPDAAPEVEPQLEENDPVKALEQRLKAERASFERRLHRKHAEAAIAKDRAARLEQQLAQRQADPDSQAQIDVETIAEQRAQELVEQQTLQSKVRDVLAKGAKLENFDAAVNTAIEDLGLLDGKGKPTPYLAAILESDAPHEVMHYLGTNPEVTDSLQGLSPTQFARRLARIEAQMQEAKAPKVSAAPRPITPVAGTASSDGDPSTMTDAQFAAWRRKQIAARR